MSNRTENFSSTLLKMPLSTEDGTQSDHHILMGTVDLGRKRGEKKQKIVRPLTEKGREMFGKMLRSELWQGVCNEDDPNKATNQFVEKINYFLDVCLPEKVVEISELDKPWITDFIKHQIKQRKKLFRKGGRTDEWKEKKQFTEKIILEAKRNFYKNKVEKLKNSKPRNWFSAIKSLQDDEKPREWTPTDIYPNKTAQVIADEMAAFFARVSQEFDALVTADIPVVDGGAQGIEVSGFQIFEKISKMTIPNSMVPGDIPPKLVKEFAAEISLPLENVFRKILKKKIWPDAWKVETVVPIPKTRSPSDYNDVRNVSLTPFFSKLLESFVKDDLLKSIGKTIDKAQFGGIKGIGSVHAIAELMTGIMENLEGEKTVSVLASYDFSKAYSRCHHKDILNGLQIMGGTGWQVEILASYLQNRVMKVRIDKTYSSIQQLPGGNPQGTILGNICYAIQSNDVGGNFDESLGRIKYIDDNSTNEAVVVQEGQMETQPPLTQDAFDKLQEYAKNSGQVLNAKKTVMIPISERIQRPRFFLVTKAGERIQESGSSKFLGIHLTNKPNLNQHLEYVMTKAKQRIWLLRNLKKAGVKESDLSQVYKSMIRSLFDYCAQVHSVMSGCTIKSRMEAVQVKALRVIYGFDIDRKSMRERSGIDTLEEHHKKMTEQFVDKAIRNERLKHWFPLRNNSYIDGLRNPRIVEESIARSSRLFLAPIYAYRRLANMLESRRSVMT